MVGFSTEQALLIFGYLGVFVLMIANGFVGFPSSQILYIIAGYFISRGDFNWPAVSLVGATGNTIGTIILYEIARRRGIRYLARWRVFPEREVKKIQVAFNRRGVWFLFVGKLLPAIKVCVPIAAGVAGLNRLLYACIMFLSSYVWSLGFLAIGFYFGKSSDVFGRYAVALLIVTFLVLAIFYRYINSEGVIKEVEGM